MTNQNPMHNEGMGRVSFLPAISSKRNDIKVEDMFSNVRH